MSDKLWNYDAPVSELDIAVPSWIEQDITCYDLAAIIQGGCASGAYMPAVTYHQALATMQEHGDDVLEYIEDAMGELPKPNDGESWAGMACFYLSVAVELWAHGIEDDVIGALEDADDDDDDD